MDFIRAVELAADPATWDAVKTSPGLPLLFARREAHAKLPTRAEAKPAWEDLGFAYSFDDEGPMRLRFPKPY